MTATKDTTRPVQSCAAVIVAGGKGLRAGGTTRKQFRDLAGRSVLQRSLDAFSRHPGIDRIVVVLPADQIAAHQLDAGDCPLRVVAGGTTRAASVLAGLSDLTAAPPDHVLIHDGARPLVSARVIAGVIAALADHRAAAPGLPVTDSLWQSDGAQITGLRDRDGLFRAQTPQGFHFADILAAHRAGDTDSATDDIALALAAGIKPALVPGDETNLKITAPGDFRRAEQMLEARMTMRIGTGFDVHAFGPGDHVTLCGIDLPHDRGLSGHSDADVAMHALTDAIYGALAQGDIGRWFPPSDPQWKGAASDIFLTHAVELATKSGLRIGNADITIICEMPKIGPYADAMCVRLADLMGCAVDRVSVKATTSERLGFTGRGEGIAAQASVFLETS